MSKKEPYSDKRWQGSPDELKMDPNYTPTEEETKKHDEFMKKFQKAYGLDENGNE